MYKKRKRNSGFKKTVERSVKVDVETQREINQKRLKSAWDDIIARYGCDLTEETDEIDLMTGEDETRSTTEGVASKDFDSSLGMFNDDEDVNQEDQKDEDSLHSFKENYHDIPSISLTSTQNKQNVTAGSLDIIEIPTKEENLHLREKDVIIKNKKQEANLNRSKNNCCLLSISEGFEYPESGLDSDLESITDYSDSEDIN
ncbi:13452_t:CDS:2 [Ambispora leptoticha]|uniref:13452_t:CDS:1 n=1 Tax=Ambispora leptoticha TaxID=144679 RepID=A0A9N9HHH2_9GLOM|nr:13452_t:CDS:2 [Ambispora leptoticha]